MNTTDKQSEVKNLIQDFYKNKEIENRKINELLKNEEYILWLEHFTIHNYSFSDNDWAYSLGNISMKDKKKIDDLHLLYRAIEEYAKKNLIYPKINEFGIYYSIKFNDIGYKIGNMFNEGKIFFCSRVTINKEEEFIDFNNIKNNQAKSDSKNALNSYTLQSKVKVLGKFNKNL